MADHIGEIVRIANPYSRGLTNDHVAVQPHWDINIGTYCAYARSDYNVKNGPEPIPRDGDFDRIPILAPGERLRGWGTINIVCETVFEEALKLATAEAQRRKFVLYFEGPDHKTTIKWHPDGWEPQQG